MLQTGGADLLLCRQPARRPKAHNARQHPRPHLDFPGLDQRGKPRVSLQDGVTGIHIEQLHDAATGRNHHRRVHEVPVAGHPVGEHALLTEHVDAQVRGPTQRCVQFARRHVHGRVHVCHSPRAENHQRPSDLGEPKPSVTDHVGSYHGNSVDHLSLGPCHHQDVLALVAVAEESDGVGGTNHHVGVEGPLERLTVLGVRFQLLAQREI
mmetsp:Transcript_39712/g.86708  ORF Transcript_39712/g.86708 Transcript_39712/m.86708 type:complete len:209 (-) Transcript_39712:329-955(-)